MHRSAVKEPSTFLSFAIICIYLFGTIPIFGGIAFLHKLFRISPDSLKANLSEFIILVQAGLTITLTCFLIVMYKQFFFGDMFRAKLKSKLATGLKWSIPVVLYHLMVIVFPSTRENLFSSVLSLESISVKSISSLGLFYFLSLLLSGAILEELIFRGILLNKILNFLNVSLSLIISSIVFSLTHFIFFKFFPGSLVSHFCIGILCGAAYLRYRSSVSAFVPHILNNLIWFIYTLSVFHILRDVK